MEIIKTIRDGNNSVENHIKIENGNYVHRQIEKINGRVFMRVKSRKIFEILPKRARNSEISYPQ